MNCEEALKRLKQETCPCTYNPDFDKNECLEVIKKTLEEQKTELLTWYQAWLDVTETGIIPEKPEWLK